MLLGRLSADDKDLDDLLAYIITFPFFLFLWKTKQKWEIMIGYQSTSKPPDDFVSQRSHYSQVIQSNLETVYEP